MSYDYKIVPGEGVQWKYQILKDGKVYYTSTPRRTYSDAMMCADDLVNRINSGKQPCPA